MKRKHVISRLTTLALATTACLLLALLAPLFVAHRATDESFPSSSVMASPRDLHVVTAPIQLSDEPDLVLNRGALYADGNVAAGLPSSRFVLDTPVFTLNASGMKATAEYLDSGSGTMSAAFAPLVEQLTGMGFDTLAIQHGTLHVTSADGVTETFSDIDAEVSGRRKGMIAAKGTFKVRGQNLQFDGSLSQNADKATPLRWPAKLTVKGDLLEATLDGHINVAEDLQLTGQTEISTPSVRRAARWFGVPIPISSGLNAASLKGQLSWGRRSLTLENAKVVVDGNEASGTIALNVGGERPLVDGTLAFTALDLTPYVEAARAQSFVFERLTSSWSEFDLNFPIIKHVDADLRISAPKIAMSGYGFGRGAAAITIRGGKLIADVAELELLNSGRASAQVTADSGEPVPHYTLRGKVENLDTGPAAAALFGTAVLSGRGTMAVELTSSGQTPVEIMRGLSGKASLTMPDGGRVALDAKALRGAAKAGLGPGWGVLGKGTTTLEQIYVRTILRGGVLLADTVWGQSGSLGVGATGRMDVVEGSLDLNVLTKSSVPTDRPLTMTDLTGGEAVSVQGSWRAPLIRAPEGEVHEPASK